MLFEVRMFFYIYLQFMKESSIYLFAMYCVSIFLGAIPNWQVWELVLMQLTINLFLMHATDKERLVASFTAGLTRGLLEMI